MVVLFVKKKNYIMYITIHKIIILYNDMVAALLLRLEAKKNRNKSKNF